MTMQWRIETLGNIARVIAGQSPQGTAYNPNGIGTPFYQGKKEYGERYLLPPAVWTTQETKIAEAGDLLISVRAPVGALNFATQRICIGRGIAAIRTSKLSPDFLFYALSNLSIKGKEGAVFASINRTEIEAIPIPVPPPLEQERIVGILDAAFEKIDAVKQNAEANLQNAKELFQQALSEAMTPKEEWTPALLEEVVASSCSLSYGIVQPGNEYKNGIPIVRPVDLSGTYVYKIGLKRIAPEIAMSYRRTLLHGGELLLCVRGETGILGIAAAELDGCNVTRGIVPILFDSTKIISSFGMFIMSSPQMQCQIKQATRGTALMQINIGDLRKLSLSYPEVHQQNEIAQRLQTVVQKHRSVTENFQKVVLDCDELKKTILTRAFAGEL